MFLKFCAAELCQLKALVPVLDPLDGPLGGEQQQLIAIGEYGIISVGPGGAALLGQDKLMGDIPLVHFLDRCPEKGSPGDQLLLQPITHPQQS